jgi:hypothetical protein
MSLPSSPKRKRDDDKDTNPVIVKQLVDQLYGYVDGGEELRKEHEEYRKLAEALYQQKREDDAREWNKLITRKTEQEAKLAKINLNKEMRASIPISETWWGSKTKEEKREIRMKHQKLKDEKARIERDKKVDMLPNPLMCMSCKSKKHEPKWCKITNRRTTLDCESGNLGLVQASRPEPYNFERGLVKAPVNELNRSLSLPIKLGERKLIPGGSYSTIKATEEEIIDLTKLSINKVEKKTEKKVQYQWVKSSESSSVMRA